MCIPQITFLLLFVAIFTAKILNAQAYRPMLVDSVRWIVVYDLMESPWDDDIRWEYYALGDTLVNGMDYKKIYLRYLDTPHSGPPFNAISNYQLAALMREDTTARQVFGIPLQLNYRQTECPEGQESLLYDFSLSIGDTVFSCVIVYGGLIVEIGYAFFHEINTRYLQTNHYQNYYEGIGSEYGLFEAMWQPVKSSNLWTIRLDYYCPTADCPFLVSTAEMQANSKIEVYPNPSNGKFAICLPQNQNFHSLKVYSFNGNLVYTRKMTSSNLDKINLDISFLPPGSYILHLQLDEPSSIYTKKLIINKRGTNR
jgi:hypothetical protein